MPFAGDGDLGVSESAGLGVSVRGVTSPPDSERFSMPCPNIAFVGEDDLKPPSSSSFDGVSPLTRCAFAFAMFVIQSGWLLRAGVGLGESGFVIELSSQLDFVGLQRLDGLEGGEMWPSSAVVLYVEATDLLLL